MVSDMKANGYQWKFTEKTCEDKEREIHSDISVGITSFELIPYFKSVSEWISSIVGWENVKIVSTRSKCSVMCLTNLRRNAHATIKLKEFYTTWSVKRVHLYTFGRAKDLVTSTGLSTNLAPNGTMTLQLSSTQKRQDTIVILTS